MDECVQVLKTALRGLNYYQTYDRLFLGYVAHCYIEINLLYYVCVAKVNEMNNCVFACLLADFVWLYGWFLVSIAYILMLVFLIKYISYSVL